MVELSSILYIYSKKSLILLLFLYGFWVYLFDFFFYYLVSKLIFFFLITYFLLFQFFFYFIIFLLSISISFKILNISPNICPFANKLLKYFLSN